jgi:hypothetical protein
MERSQKGNVSYPQWIYTVPGVPVSCSHSITGSKGLPFAKMIDFAAWSSSRESEAAQVDLGIPLTTDHRDDPVLFERSS